MRKVLFVIWNTNCTLPIRDIFASPSDENHFIHWSLIQIFNDFDFRIMKTTSFCEKNLIVFYNYGFIRNLIKSWRFILLMLKRITDWLSKVWFVSFFCKRLVLPVGFCWLKVKRRVSVKGKEINILDHQSFSYVQFYPVLVERKVPEDWVCIEKGANHILSVISFPEFSWR